MKQHQGFEEKTMATLTHS